MTMRMMMLALYSYDDEDDDASMIAKTMRIMMMTW